MAGMKAVVVYVALLLACSLDYCHSEAMRSAVYRRRTTYRRWRTIATTTTTSGDSYTECHSEHSDTSFDILEKALDSKLLEIPAVYASKMRPEYCCAESEPYILSGLDSLRHIGTLRSICQNGGKVFKLQLRSERPVVVSLQWNTRFGNLFVNVTHHNLSVDLEIPIRIEQSYSYRRCHLDCVQQVNVYSGPVTFSQSTSSITVDGCEMVSSDLGRSGPHAVAERFASAVIKKSLTTDNIMPWLKTELLDIYLRRTVTPQWVSYDDYSPSFSQLDSGTVPQAEFLS